MSEEVMKLKVPKKVEDLVESAELLKRLHDEILAHINSTHTKKFDELILKMSSSSRF